MSECSERFDVYCERYPLAMMELAERLCVEYPKSMQNQAWRDKMMGELLARGSSERKIAKRESWLRDHTDKLDRALGALSRGFGEERKKREEEAMRPGTPPGLR